MFRQKEPFCCHLVLPWRINISTSLCASVKRDVVKIRVHLPQRPLSGSCSWSRDIKMWLWTACLKRPLNKIQSNLSSFPGECNICGILRCSEPSNKLFSLNREFPSQFWGLHMLLFSYARLSAALTPSWNLLKIQLWRTQDTDVSCVPEKWLLETTHLRSC